MPEPIRLLHIITTTDTGGAEAMLAKLCKSLDKDKFACRVVSMVHAGPIAKDIAESGVQVDSLELDLGRPKPGAFFRLVQIIRKFKPHVVQSWLYHADFLNLFASRLSSRARIAWNVRNSNIDFSQYNRLTEWVVKACALLSRFPDAVIANSYCGRDLHLKMGYKCKRFEVIPNGFDLERFSRNEAAGAKIRGELGIGAADPVLVMFARQDPMKDHATLLKATDLLRRDFPEIRLILCGDRVDPGNAALYGIVNELGLEKNAFLLGRRRDVPEILSAADVSVLSSYGEGFPNVVGEAMACQVPVAANNVGDTVQVIGPTGRIVPNEDAAALAGAIKEILSLSVQEKQELGLGARRRIEELYSLEAIVKQYEDFYTSLVI